MFRSAMSALFCLAAAPGAADEYAPAMQSYFETEIAGWVQDPVLIEAVRSQNMRTRTYTQAEIDALDAAWRAEIGQSEQPTIAPVMNNAAANFLRDRVAATGGAITEIFVLDAKGLNVAASDTTSDFWQGDEAKFTETFPNGPGAVHMGDVELDESSQRFQGQISMTLTDPKTGVAIGAITVGVDAQALM